MGHFHLLKCGEMILQRETEREREREREREKKDRNRKRELYKMRDR